MSATAKTAISLRSSGARPMRFILAETRDGTSLEPEHGRHGELQDVLRVVTREVELEAREGDDAQTGSALVAVLAAVVEQPLADGVGVVQRAGVADLVVRIRVEATARGERDV